MPNTCCHNDKGGSYVSNDTCMCGGCSYFNGWAPIVGVQLLAMIGMFFSIAAFGDCSFMELNERLFFPPDMFEENFKDNSDLPIEVTQTQFVGFLTWKKLDGSCYWYNSGVNPEEQIKTFVVDILGRDWEIPRIFSGLSASLSFLFFCYLLSFTCSSQTRGVRYFNTVFLCLILTTLQGLTFYDNSTFCEEYICTYSRSAGFSAAAIGCFFLSGLCFCCTHDYSGPRRKNKHTIYRIAPVERVVSAPPQMAASNFAPATAGDKSEAKVVGGRNSVRESRPREENYDTSTYSNNEVRSQSSLTYLEKSYLQLKKQKQQQEQQHSQVDSPRSNNEINNNSSEHPISHEPETKPQYYSSADISDDEEMIEEIMEDYETDEVEVCSVTTSGTSIADNTDKNKDFIEETTENDCDDDFIAHPDLEEGDDCEVITEVTKDEIKVVETIRHADGSQTITETYEERADEKGYI
mmetsp:Transcript_4112/g.4663  ORF Transcript_4112/g.4663 Transcript_4112/m.4663 type:complete len:465 (-) Transcript_4112:274-1668(-)